jgi:uncharacterized protein YjdB
MSRTSLTSVIVGVLGSISLLGCAPKPASVEISPPDIVINAPGETPTVSARALDAQDQPIEGAKFAWSTSDESIVAINPETGALTVKGSGRAEITAQAGTATGSTIVNVSLFTKLATDVDKLLLKIGQAQKITATILDEKGKPIDGAVDFAIGDQKVATVDAMKGEVRGVGPGTTAVTATAKALKAEVAVEVMKPGPAELGVSKAFVELKVGKTAKVEGKPLDENAQPAEGYAVSYESDDPSVATVSEDGTVTGVAAGETHLVVSAGDKEVTVKVVVK